MSLGSPSLACHLFSQRNNMKLDRLQPVVHAIHQSRSERAEFLRALRKETKVLLQSAQTLRRKCTKSMLTDLRKATRMRKSERSQLRSEVVRMLTGLRASRRMAGQSDQFKRQMERDRNSRTIMRLLRNARHERLTTSRSLRFGIRNTLHAVQQSVARSISGTRRLLSHNEQERVASRRRWQTLSAR